MDISKIYEGWKNHLFPSDYLKEVITMVSNARMIICDGCKHNSKYHKSYRFDGHCIVCGCTLIAKTKCLSCECPVDKWFGVMSVRQEDEMTDYGEKTG